MGERQGGHPAVATFCIGTLAIEIRDIIAPSVGFRNAAPLATHFAINPNYAPFSIQINSLSCQSKYCLLIQLNRYSPENRPAGRRESRAVDGILDKLTLRQHFVAGIGRIVLLGIPEPSPAIGRNNAGQRSREAVGGQYILSGDPLDGRELVLGGNVPTGIRLMPSGLPSGMFTNIERKFPTPLLLAIISFISSSVSSSMFGSVA